MGIARSEFLEEPGTIIPLPSGIIFENTIFSKSFHSMQALKTKLFLLKSSLTFGILNPYQPNHSKRSNYLMRFCIMCLKAMA